MLAGGVEADVGVERGDDAERRRRLVPEVGLHHRRRQRSAVVGAFAGGGLGLLFISLLKPLNLGFITWWVEIT